MQGEEWILKVLLVYYLSDSFMFAHENHEDSFHMPVYSNRTKSMLGNNSVENSYG